MEYIVRPGDTLSLIARVHDTTVATLMRLNPEIENANHIRPEQPVRLPQGTERQTRSVGQVSDCSACVDEFVDLLHQADEGILVPLTASEQREIEKEEAVLEQLIRQFHAALESAEENIVAFKDDFLDRLRQERIVDESKPSSPFNLTEIRRLKGNRHYAYVRKDSGWRRHRSYSIEAQDRARQKGWYNPESGKVDGKKLVRTIAEDLQQPRFNLTLHESFTDWCLLEWQSKADKWTPPEGVPPIDAGVQAQVMRFAMGAALQAGYNPRKGHAHIAAKASASLGLAEGKAYASMYWPAEEDTEWLIHYREEGQLLTRSLGRFRARASTELSGFAGASAMLSANIHVEMNNGIPQLRGTGSAGRRSGDPASVEAGAFAGIRADGRIEGSIEWQDTLAPTPEWKALCTLGAGAGAALGLGAEAHLRIKWSTTTHKFYFNVHAGLVVGPGASGEFAAEVDAGTFVTMVKCIYNALLEVDFHKVEEIDTGAFAQLTHFAMLGILTGTSHAAAAVRLGSEAAEQVFNDLRRFLAEHRSALERERLAISTANNVLKDLSNGESSWLKYSPPEVKGRLLDILCFDYGPTFWDRFTVGQNSREQAVVKLLQLSQCWRDYEETVTRINSTGSKGGFDANRDRLLRLIRAYPALQIDTIEQRLEGTRAIPNRPVQLARHFRLEAAHHA